MNQQIRLRRLEEKDIPGMLEWMHDPKISRWFRFNAAEMDVDRARDFIARSFSETDRHYAITGEDDVYLGTISLEEIDPLNGHALYAISLRSCAQGTGTAMASTKELLRIAFEELGLERVYLNVLSDNLRARRFYEKAGFRHEGCFRRHLKLHGEWHDWEWYAILRSEFYAGTD